MNRIQQLFSSRREDILNIYFTAGFPGLQDTEQIILSLEAAGADLIELVIEMRTPSSAPINFCISPCLNSRLKIQKSSDHRHVRGFRSYCP